ncbi:hypothetical protein Poly51_59030 [Rubripirellula tenax]|uniref:Uncharacterized protein n=1 Tax=Rubripirellula tenax TaxID=2528015 RepID=A0A5C6E7S9_9BACT|nr:hypothetical protein Poly51_59030 [Rubripirellula tenax]
MQFGVHPFEDEGCTTCAFYNHSQSRCKHGLPKNAGEHEGPYIPAGLSPCRDYEKGFEFIPGSWGRFKPVSR